jgi:hypothetical protein
MKQLLILLISFFLICAFAGCMMEPYKQAFDKDSGPYPEHYLEIINGFLAEDLEKPESIMNLTIIKPPEKIVIEHHQESISLAEGHEVWECFITFEAENRNKRIVKDFHVVWMRNGRIVAYDYQKPDLIYRFEHRFDPEPSPEETPENIPEAEPEK